MEDRGHRAPYLIVEPDPDLAKQLTVKLARHAPTLVARNATEARLLMNERETFSGMCVDLKLPDGNGLELVETMRKRQPRLVALVLTRLHDPSLLGDEADDNTVVSTKPPTSVALSAFLVRSLGISRPVSSLPPRRHTPPAAVAPAGDYDPGFVRRMEQVKSLAHRHGLTVREQQILGLSVEGRSPADAMRALDIDEGDYDEAIANILTKTGASNIGQLALQVVRDAMKGSL